MFAAEFEEEHKCDGDHGNRKQCGDHDNQRIDQPLRRCLLLPLLLFRKRVGNDVAVPLAHRGNIGKPGSRKQHAHFRKLARAHARHREADGAVVVEGHVAFKAAVTEGAHVVAADDLLAFGHRQRKGSGSVLRVGIPASRDELPIQLVRIGVLLDHTGVAVVEHERLACVFSGGKRVNGLLVFVIRPTAARRAAAVTPFLVERDFLQSRFPPRLVNDRHRVDGDAAVVRRIKLDGRQRVLALELVGTRLHYMQRAVCGDGCFDMVGRAFVRLVRKKRVGRIRQKAKHIGDEGEDDDPHEDPVEDVSQLKWPLAFAARHTILPTPLCFQLTRPSGAVGLAPCRVKIRTSPAVRPRRRQPHRKDHVP